MRNRWTLIVPAVLLVVYSGILLGIEAGTSQDYARQFVTDITGPVPFYAVNTTLSVSLLWGTALLFAVCSVCAQLDSDHSSRLFFLSQTAIFFWLGCDDRFQIHETTARWLSIGDHYVLAAVAVVQLLLLAKFALHCLPKTAFVFLAAASFFFAVMFVVDAWFPHDGWLRLTFEDVAKTWACAFFFGMAWTTLSFRLHQLRFQTSSDHQITHLAVAARSAGASTPTDQSVSRTHV